MIISLLFVYLYSTTEFNQLLKLSFLVEHFIEHKEENQSLSFLDFLKMHYLLDSTKHADKEKDMKLPFKSGHACEQHSNFKVCLSDHFSEWIVDHYFYLQKEFSIENDHFNSSAHLHSIWQLK